MAERIIYDGDPGADDALAILLALGHPDIELTAITCVAGNVGLDNTSANALRLLELAKRTDIPVYVGSHRPLMVNRGRTSSVHGGDGLADSPLPAPTTPFAKGHAANEIIRRARAEGQLHIAAAGPLTNLALALVLDPELPKFIKHITLMGGAAFVPGNTTPLAEFNFHVDPHAAAIVFDSGIPITMLGLDVTRQAILPGATVDDIEAHGTTVAIEAARILRSYRSHDPCLHDPAAIAWIIAPERFKSVAAHVSIDVNPGPTAGQVVAAVSERHLAGRKPNCTVVTGLDVEWFGETLAMAVKSV